MLGHFVSRHMHLYIHDTDTWYIYTHTYTMITHQFKHLSLDKYESGAKVDQ